jgi:hypothetical protein
MMFIIWANCRVCSFKYRQDVFQKEKCVEHNVNVVAAGRDAELDPEEQKIKRCILGCALCEHYNHYSCHQ